MAIEDLGYMVPIYGCPGGHRQHHQGKPTCGTLPASPFSDQERT
jgi:hypothetical protein